MSVIAEGYEAVRRQVAHAADSAGRSFEDVTIVAVTKHVGVAEIQKSLAVGISDFGENRVQELVGKHGLFPEARWHFIGTLQTNKVKDVVGKACLIHSVHSLHLLEAIDRKAAEIGVIQPVLLQVNVSGEESKHGFPAADVREALIEAGGLGNTEVRGLMTMAPFGRPEDSRWVFRELRELRDSLCEMPLNSVDLAELSMGMTNDYRVAVEEGATIVRVGRAIFGK
ncbi:MAG: YggS family pyridoxal phosphate-dependent enzyme [Coriobacteriia bacterium]|nr:YggS family pyridoxal phosphate-dependent enzyme [Coriobacteriia bacterium]